MTFRDQLRFTFRLGFIVLLASGILFGAMHVAKSAGYSGAGEVLFVITLVVLAVAVLALVPGIIARSFHRWMWFKVILRSERTVFGRTPAQRLLDSPASPILRRWLHICPEGKDRDGLISTTRDTAKSE